MNADVDPSTVVGDTTTKKNFEEEKRTDLQVIKDTQKMLTASKIDNKLLDIISEATEHCPRLFLLVHGGYPQGRSV